MHEHEHAVTATVVETTWQPLPSDLATLFEHALGTLESEDRQLRELMARRTRHRDRKGEHPGLTYWLYETTLVYLVFKAWLPHVDAMWEPTYENDAAHHVDLAIRGPDGVMTAAFEAKWWHSSGVDEHITAVTAEDVRRLRHGTLHETQRYLVLFWWDLKERAERARTFAEQLANRLSAEVRDSEVTPRWLGHFETHRRDDVVAQFVICVLSVA